MDIGEQIDSIRQEWGRRLVILGHYYQRASVLKHADEVGDSLELARRAAGRKDAERVILCGVKFMAESADILTGPAQQVYMPETAAGCPMANMADAASMQAALNLLERHGGGFLPVVYVNSTADVKAICGRQGGSACTSSNARKILDWAFNQGKRVFFLPDEHLALNTAHDMGIPDDETAVFDPSKENGGLSLETLRRARVIAWKGFCLVHTRFTLEMLTNARRAYPTAKVIVHPETPREVVRLADAHGSTAQIIKFVEAQPDGSIIIIGTENNLVEQLAERFAGRLTIKALWPSVCANMAKTHEAGLLKLMQEWPAENRVSVPESVARDARLALERMLAV